MFYSKNKQKVFNKTMTRDLASRQSMKLCFVCSKPFSRRKGPRKTIPVANTIGRYVCEQCTDKPMKTEAIENRHESTEGAQGTP